jgi:hypothetical protein
MQEAWWKLKGDKAATEVNRVVDAISNTWGSIRDDRYLRQLRMYKNSKQHGLFPGQYWGSVTAAEPVRMNVTRSMVDSVWNQLASSKPQSSLLPYDAKPSEKRRAEKLAQFRTGLRQSERVHEKSRAVVRDMLIHGFGALRVKGRPDKKTKRADIEVSRVLPWSLYVDPADAYMGAPRSLHHVELVDRSVLMDAMPHKEALIRKLNRCTRITKTGVNSEQEYQKQGVVYDTVRVISSWHLRSGKSATDGVFMVSTDMGELESMPYEDDHFPIVTMCWTDPHVGWADCASSLVDEAMPEQMQLAEITQNIAKGFAFCKGFFFNPAGSGVDSENITNDPDVPVLEGTAAPQKVDPTPIHPQYFQYAQDLYNKSYELRGVSQLQAQSEKPGGVTAAAALQTLTDVGSRRFRNNHQRNDQFHIDLDLAMFREARRMDKAGYAVETSLTDTKKGFATRIVWPDVAMEENQFTLVPAAVNALSDDPAQRVQQITELTNSGIFSQERAALALGDMDLPGEEKLASADSRIIEADVEKMAEEGMPVSPSSYHDLAQAADYARRYLLAHRAVLEPERYDLIEDYMNKANAMLRQRQQQAQQTLQSPDELMNGAQVTSIVELVKAVALQEISPQSGAAVLQKAFGMSQQEAAAVIGPVPAAAPQQELEQEQLAEAAQ